MRKGVSYGAMVGGEGMEGKFVKSFEPFSQDLAIGCTQKPGLENETIECGKYGSGINLIINAHENIN